jgi:hypothetical protein
MVAAARIAGVVSTAGGAIGVTASFSRAAVRASTMVHFELAVVDGLRVPVGRPSWRESYRVSFRRRS